MKDKKELDNREILSKLEKSRIKIKNKVNLLIKEVDKELRKIGLIGENYKLNDHNCNLLANKSAKIVNFKEAIIDFWAENLTEP